MNLATTQSQHTPFQLPDPPPFSWTLG